MEGNGREAKGGECEEVGMPSNEMRQARCDVELEKAMHDSSTNDLDRWERVHLVIHAIEETDGSG